MKNFTFVFSLILSIFIYENTLFSFQTKAKQAILIDYHSNTELFEKNSRVKMTPSSMTKIMTVFLTFEALSEKSVQLSDKFYVSKKAWRQKGSRMFIEVDTLVTVDDLIQGTIVSSGNDSSITLAEGISGSEEAFVQQMNEKAKALGALNTHFVNSNGWPNENHYSTAYDLAQISLATIKNFPMLYSKYYFLHSYKYNDILQYSHNKLLQKKLGHYHVDGLKTGFTDSGGYGIAVSAVSPSNMRLVAIVNGLENPHDRIESVKSLLMWGFNNFDSKMVVQQNKFELKIPTNNGDQEEVLVESKKDYYLSQNKNESSEINAIFVEKNTTAPIKKGDFVGDIVISKSGKEELRIPLYSKNKLEEVGFFKEKFRQLKNLFYKEKEDKINQLNRSLKTKLNITI